MFVGAGALAFLLVCCGGLAVIGALTGDPARTRSTAAEGTAPEVGDPTPASLATAPPTTKQPVTETRTITETQEIPFPTRNVNDANLPQGTTRVRTAGVPGVKTLTYEVTFVDGTPTTRKLLREEVTRQPVTEVVAVGTRTAAKCDPNYEWVCVPIASDVDCSGGSGNGPAYVKGPVKVVGDDIYDLDADGDGIGCE